MSHYRPPVPRPAHLQPHPPALRPAALHLAAPRVEEILHRRLMTAMQIPIFHITVMTNYRVKVN